MTMPLEISPSDVVDILLVSSLFWGGLVWLRRSRARLVMVGIAVLGVVFLVASRTALNLTAWLLQGFFVVVVLVVALAFQEDLRRLFERIAAGGLWRRTPLPAGPTDTLVRTAARLASTRTGALIVLPGKDPLDRHVEGGIEIGGALSEPLLLSLFDASSPGHDGAVVIDGGRVARFAVHLPLSSDRAKLGPGGTRHAAALGLAERCDALCIVVSEERGTISVAWDGHIRVVPDASTLAALLGMFFEGDSPESPQPVRWRGALLRGVEPFAALALAAGLWVLVVPGSAVIEVEREAVVQVENLPEGFALETVKPESVSVVLSGKRRDLLFADPTRLRVRIDALLVQLGRRTFKITTAQVDHPDGVRVIGVEPESVRLSVTRETASKAAAGGSS